MYLSARDVYGDRLPVPVRVEIERLGTGSRRLRRAEIPPLADVEIPARETKTYRLVATADRYATVSRIVSGTVDSVGLILPVRANAVVGFEWPDEFPEIPGVEWPDGSGLLATSVRLGDARDDGWKIASLLNVWAKLWTTTIGVAPAALFVTDTLEVRRDRVFFRLSADALALLEDADNVDRVPSDLHHPPAGFESYENGVSIKTRDAVANLQISTFVGPSGDVIADVDLDEARGFRHVFEVVKNHATGSKTDPVEILSLLVAVQNIDPGYRPVV